MTQLAGVPGAGNASARYTPARLTLVGAFVALLVAGFAGLPRGHWPLPGIARRAVTMAIPAWHTTEPVNALVYGTRGFDTVGETFLLVAAVVSVVLIARRRERRSGADAEEALATGERGGLTRGGGFRDVGDAVDSGDATGEAKDAERSEGSGIEDRHQDAATTGHRPDPNEGMTVVTRIATHALLPVLSVVALVVVSWGYAPGGGFPAAVALCGVALLVYASRGLGALGPLSKPDVLETIEVAASLGLLLVAVGGFVRHGSVTANFLPLGVTGTIQGGGELQVMSGVELFEVAGGLLLVLVALLTMRHDWNEERPPGPDGGKR